MSDFTTPKYVRRRENTCGNVAGVDGVNSVPLHGDALSPDLMGAFLSKCAQMHGGPGAEGSPRFCHISEGASVAVFNFGIVMPKHWSKGRIEIGLYQPVDEAFAISACHTRWKPDDARSFPGESTVRAPDAYGLHLYE